MPSEISNQNKVSIICIVYFFLIGIIYFSYAISDAADATVVVAIAAAATAAFQQQHLVLYVQYA